MYKEYKNTRAYLAFSDKGIICIDTEKALFYPYGSIEKIDFSIGSLTIIGKVNGIEKRFFYVSITGQGKEIKTLVSFAKSMMETAPKAEVIEKKPRQALKDTLEELESVIKTVENTQNVNSNHVTYPEIEKTREKNRVKNRNIGLIIMALSILALLIAFTSTDLAVLAIISIFVGFIGFLIFGRNIKPPKNIIVPTSNSGTKEIVKGAVVGSIVAGDVGAVVGAVAAKNKIDNQKK